MSWTPSVQPGITRFEGKFDWLTRLVRAVELLAVDQRAAVVDHNNVRSLRALARAFAEDLVLKTGGCRLDALLFGVFLEETLTIFESGLCHYEREKASVTVIIRDAMRMEPPLRQKEVLGNTENQ